MSFDIIHPIPQVLTPVLLPEQERALVRELCAVAPWLTYNEAVYLLDSDPYILDPLGKAYLRQHSKEYQAKLRQFVLPLQRPGTTTGMTVLCQESEGLYAGGSGGAQGEANCPSNSVNSFGAFGAGAGASFAPASEQVGAAAPLVASSDWRVLGLHGGADGPASSRISAVTGVADVGAGDAGVVVELVQRAKFLPVLPKRFRWVSRDIRRAAVDMAKEPGERSWWDAPCTKRGRWSAKSVSSSKTQNPKQKEINEKITEIIKAGEASAVSVKIDWLSMTVKCLPSSEVEMVEKLKTLLGAAWLERSGKYGYTKRLVCGNVWIMWGGQTTVKEQRQGMGVHVQASGQGISELEARGVSDWLPWLAARVQEGFDFTRSDFAFDVKNGAFTVDMVEEASRAGLVSSRFDWHEPEAPRDSRGNLLARGFNFGRREANSRVCFYDKALEQQAKQGAKGKDAKKVDVVDVAAHEQKQQELEAAWAVSGSRATELDAPASEQISVEEAGAVESWTRVEMRLRNRVASEVIKKLLAEGWGVLAGVLASILDIKEQGSGEQRCRWDTVPWWAAFLAHAEKAPVALDPKVRTLQGGMAAMKRQYQPLLAAASAVYPEFYGWLLGVVQELDPEQLPERYQAMMAAYGGLCEKSALASDFRTDAIPGAVTGMS